MFEIKVNDNFLNVLKDIPNDILLKLIDVTISVNPINEELEEEFVEDFITELLRR